MDALEDLSRVAVEIDGRRAELVLRAPTVGFELPLLPSASAPETEARRRDKVGLVLAGLIQSVDGAPLSRELRRSLAMRPAALLRLRAELFDDARHVGRVLLGCPRCAQESGVSLAVLAIALGADVWPIADADGFPSEPSLSTLRPLGARPAGVALAAGARLLMPSARLSSRRPFTEAVLGDPVTAARDADAWSRWVLADQPFDPARAHWTWGNPGFRAILRMALALERLDDTRALTPDVIERLPMPDFLFADAAYHLLRVVDLTDPARAMIHCPACTEAFLLVV